MTLFRSHPLRHRVDVDLVAAVRVDGELRLCGRAACREDVRGLDRKSTRLNSSHTEIYTLSLHDALPISSTSPSSGRRPGSRRACGRRASALRSCRLSRGCTRARSEEHTSELQSHRDLHSFPT